MQDAWKVTTFRLLWNRSLLQLRFVVILTVKTPKFSNNRNSKSADIESKYWYEYACHWTGLEHCFRNKPFFFIFNFKHFCMYVCWGQDFGNKTNALSTGRMPKFMRKLIQNTSLFPLISHGPKGYPSWSGLQQNKIKLSCRLQSTFN